MPNLEYCCLNWFCNPFESKAIGLNDSYHNFASPTNVKQNHWTLAPSGKHGYPSSLWSWEDVLLHLYPGLHVNIGLKCDQFNWGIGVGCIGCAGGTISCGGGAGSCTGGMGVPLEIKQGKAKVQVVYHLSCLIILQNM